MSEGYVQCSVHLHGVYRDAARHTKDQVPHAIASTIGVPAHERVHGDHGYVREGGVDNASVTVYRREPMRMIGRKIAWATGRRKSIRKPVSVP